MLVTSLVVQNILHLCDTIKTAFKRQIMKYFWKKHTRPIGSS